MENINSIKTMEIPKSCLKQYIGCMVNWDYKPRLDEHIYLVWIDGEIPIKVKSKLCESEFNKYF